MKLFTFLLIFVYFVLALLFLPSITKIYATGTNVGDACNTDDTIPCQPPLLCGGVDAQRNAVCEKVGSLKDGLRCFLNSVCASRLCGGFDAQGNSICASPGSIKDGDRCTYDTVCQTGDCGGVDAQGKLICASPGSIKDGDRCYYSSVCQSGICGGDPSQTTCVYTGSQQPPVVTQPPNDKGDPSDPNSCTTWDPGYSAAQTKAVFSCQASCGGDYPTPYGDSTHTANKCAPASDGTKLTCCYNLDKYKAQGRGGLQAGGPGSGGSSSGGGASTNPGPGWCSSTSDKVTNGSATSSNLPASCLPDSSGKISGVKADTTGNAYCKSVTGDKPYFFKCNDATTSPGSGSPGAGGGSPTNGSDYCSVAGKGHLDTSVGGTLYPGYIGPTCGGALFDATAAKTAQPGRAYADRYKCTQKGLDGHDYTDVADPASNHVCDAYPWIDHSTPPATCTTNSGKTPVDCSKAFGSNYSCTYDYYNKDSRITNSTSCCPDNKRYCPDAGACVSDTQGCAGAKPLTQGTACNPAATLPNEKCDASQNLFCDDKNGTAQIPTCQYTNGVSPTPTPGAPGGCVLGNLAQGCECDAFTTGTGAGGCSSNLDCQESYENLKGDSKKMFCVPFPVTQRWCENTKSLQTSGPVCIGATPYSTPTPDPTKSLRCPNDGLHLCAIANQCVAGYSPGNDPVADQACTSWNGGDQNPLNKSVCLIKSPGKTICADGTTPTPIVTIPAVQSTPGVTVSPTVTPTPVPGCPLNNGDGRVNSCQSSCDPNGPYPNPRNDKWSEQPDGACFEAYGATRAACCTSR